MESNTTYYARARHKGLRTGVGGWSVPLVFTTENSSGFPTLMSSSAILGIENYPSNSNLYFGTALATNNDGSLLAVGSPGADISSSTENFGRVSIFSLGVSVKNTIEWQIKQTIDTPIYSANENFGFSLAMSGDGQFLFIGSKKVSDLSKGQVWAHKLNQATGMFDLVTLIHASDAVSSDIFGGSLATNSDGSILLVGAYQDDSSPYTNDGSVYYFTRSGANWTKVSKIFSSESIRASTMAFGSAVALSSDGTMALIGAKLASPGGKTNAGHVQYFKRTGNTWNFIQYFYPADGAATDWFGASLAINGAGDIAAIAAIQDDDGGTNTGSVYLFSKTDDVWTEHLKVSDQSLVNYQNGNIYSPGVGVEAGSLTGSGLALTGTGKTMFVGQPGRDGDNRGEVYTFGTELSYPRFNAGLLGGSTIESTYAISDLCLSPNLRSFLLASDAGGYLKLFSNGGVTDTFPVLVKTYTGNFFSAAMSNDNSFPGSLGDVLIAGKRVSPGSTVGVVSYYTSTGSLVSNPDPLALQYNFQAPNPETGDFFGYDCSITLNGLRAAIGAPGANNSSGKVFIYGLTPSGETLEEQIQNPNGPAEGEEFGSSVSLSGDGYVLAVGARHAIRNQETPTIKQGVVYIYYRENGHYVFHDTIFSETPNINNELFGQKCRLNKHGTTLAISSPNYLPGQNTNNPWGKISIFLRTGQNWSYRHKFDNFQYDMYRGTWSAPEGIALSQSGNILLATGNQNLPGYIQSFI